MLNCEDLEFSWEGMSVASCQISMSRHGNKSCCNSAIQCSICPRLHMFDKNPGLNTSEYGFLEVGVAKWLDSATYTDSAESPQATFHVHV